MVFVAAMVIGMLGYELWQRRGCEERAAKPARGDAVGRMSSSRVAKRNPPHPPLTS